MQKYVELFFCRPIGIPDKWKEIVSELRLLRVILERLECSFARQEAKLDKLLNSQTSPCLEPPVSQRQQQSSATPSPHLNGQSTLSEGRTISWRAKHIWWISYGYIFNVHTAKDNILTLREKSKFNILTYNDFNDRLSDGDCSFKMTLSSLLSNRVLTNYIFPKFLTKINNVFYFTIHC